MSNQSIIEENDLDTEETTLKPKKHTISLYVANKPGVLIRISLVFARRGYNIDSLVVSSGKDPDFSTVNMVVSGDKTVLDQILKHLNKLVDVVSAKDRTDEDIIQKEMALIKISCMGEERLEVLQLAHAMKCEPVDVSEKSVILQVQGRTEELDNVNEVFNKFGIIEMVRTGKILMSRGSVITS
jgi:acetolactate synthase-1/3 small subunit